MLNINKKFERLTAFTTDGNRLPFYVHLSDKYKGKKQMVKLAQAGTSSLPATSRNRPPKLHHQSFDMMHRFVPNTSSVSVDTEQQHQQGDPSTTQMLLEGDQTFG